MTAKVEYDNTIWAILDMLNDFSADDAFAFISACQYILTRAVSRKRDKWETTQLSEDFEFR